MLIIHFKSYGYLICLILSQANICFKREPRVWAIIHKEKLRPWRCSSEYKQPQVVCVKQCQNQHSVVFIISALLIQDFQLELKKEASYLSLLYCCVLRLQLSAQSIALGRTRQPWTPPPHSFTHTTQGTAREWKVLCKLDNMLH